jgi:hypothetical protein
MHVPTRSIEKIINRNIIALEVLLYWQDLIKKNVPSLLQVRDGWRVVDDDDYRQAVGEPQAEGMMSTAASFSLS